MLKKCTGLFLVMVLAMALCPAVAMAATTISKDMEAWSNGNIPEGFEENFPDGAPDGFTVTTQEGALITCDTTPLYGNTTKKMKIVHSENVTTTVAVQLNLGNTTTNSSEYSIYFVLSELAEGGDGVKLGIKDTGGYNAYETYFFTGTQYEKWRKMMTFYAGSTKNGIMTVTFSGKGTLYLDNAEGKVVNTVVNGDLEGLIGDGILAGSETNKGGSTGGDILWTKVAHVAPWQEEPTAAGRYFVETNENNYYLLINQARTISVGFSSESGPDLTAGKSYRLRIDHKSTGGIGGGVIMDGQGFKFPYASDGRNYTCPAADWTEKAFVFVHRFGNNKTRVYFKFVGGDGAADRKSYFDNLRIEEVVEEAGLLDSETKETLSALPNGEKVTVFFKKPLINVNNDVYSKTVDNGAGGTKTEYVAAENGYETEKKITVFAALYENTGTTKTLKEIGIVEKGGITVRGAEWANTSTKLTEIGFLPAHASFDFEIPKEGNYEIKLMAWDSVESMTPAATEVYTYTTAPEA